MQHQQDTIGSAVRAIADELDDLQYDVDEAAYTAEHAGRLDRQQRLEQFSEALGALGIEPLADALEQRDALLSNPVIFHEGSWRQRIAEAHQHLARLRRMMAALRNPEDDAALCALNECVSAVRSIYVPKGGYRRAS